ncbi:conserved hypothetical protein [uncultured Eubacteriales bacterium]|uniref:DUF4367 domain-containing protein n=1 Tax=uncultured Eubacteriales bacterium TaxID=172733 RepID=A0A212IZW2_9FIRM|nr:conserved hypothetical protein [uncultured Eubacteriales bacterium]
MDGQASNPQNKYAHLDRLSTESLEALLRADIQSPDNDNDEAVFHILEVIEQREKEHPTGRLCDVDKMWAEFQQYYNIPEGEGLSLYPVETLEEGRIAGQIQKPRAKLVRIYPGLKIAGIVAAVVVGTFGLMIGAQAAGIDIFGAIGRWTNETFHFVTTSGDAQNSKGVDAHLGSEEIGYYLSLQSALDECGITEKLAPTWYPGEFNMSEPEVLSSDFGDKVLCNFDGPDNKFFSVQVQRYDLSSDLNSHIFEKDETPMEEYTAGRKTFYIMSNIDTITATWSDGNSLVMRIAGDISKDDIKTMIDSIGE